MLMKRFRVTVDQNTSQWEVNSKRWSSERYVPGASHPGTRKMVLFTTVNSTITATTADASSSSAVTLQALLRWFLHFGLRSDRVTQCQSPSSLGRPPPPHS